MNKKLTALGFKEANISSIAKIKKHIPFVEKELLNNISGLKKLLKRLCPLDCVNSDKL